MTEADVAMLGSGGDDKHVVSADGTRLRTVRRGEGDSVVLVHGTAGGKGDWLPVVQRLADQFELTAFDRRGRGGSGDGSHYSIEREVEDILAVIDASGPPVHVVAHSFGAILSLILASRHPDRLRSLVVYEPPLGVVGAPDRWIQHLGALIGQGKLDDAIRGFAQAANITEDELASIEAAGRPWQAMRDGVRTAAREIGAAREALPFGADMLPAITMPALVLLGDAQDSPSYHGVRELAEQLPDARLEQVPGRHIALVTAADQFAHAVRRFLASVPDRA